MITKITVECIGETLATAVPILTDANIDAMKITEAVGDRDGAIYITDTDDVLHIFPSHQIKKVTISKVPS